jgi:hypothetical protein
MNRAELGIDGNCGFALLGDNLQEGEAEFVEIPENSSSGKQWAAKQALLKLRERLGRPELPYYFGPSHPFGE